MSADGSGPIVGAARTVVMLLYSFDWTMGEVAEFLGMAKGTVQLHARRGLAKLRRDLGVEQ